MTVILVLATFLAFIILDYVLNRRKEVQPAMAEARPAAAPTLRPAYVEGFLVPEHLNYHNGHSWLLRERRHLVRVGRG